jgi:histidine kinase/DNA gyrase B/HSP90-like ATPase
VPGKLGRGRPQPGRMPGDDGIAGTGNGRARTEAVCARDGPGPGAMGKRPERRDLHVPPGRNAAHAVSKSLSGAQGTRGARILSVLVDAVVSNFVSNAIRYTSPGGTVEIRAARRRKPPAVVIAVRDTGTGIAPGHLGRIFDRLYRTDDARDRASGGSGLGLAIARSAARSLGACIEVDSQPGTGSEFRLILPAGAPAPGHDEPAGQQPPAASQSGAGATARLGQHPTA